MASDRFRNPAPSPVTIAPPTIAHLRSQGVAGAWVRCRDPMCLRLAPVSFKRSVSRQRRRSKYRGAEALPLLCVRLKARRRVAGLARA